MRTSGVAGGCSRSLRQRSSSPWESGSAIGSVRDFVLRTGFIGLPPIGATPSSPASGELEIFYWVDWAANGKEGRTRAWVYADGRLISLGEDPTVPGARTLCPPDSSSSGSRPKASSAFARRSRRPETSAIRTSSRRRASHPAPRARAQATARRRSPTATASCRPRCLTRTSRSWFRSPPPIDVAGLGTLVHVDHAREYSSDSRRGSPTRVVAPGERMGG